MRQGPYIEIWPFEEQIDGRSVYLCSRGHGSSLLQQLHLLLENVKSSFTNQSYTKGAVGQTLIGVVVSQR
jgi:hypothetical protein